MLNRVLIRQCVDWLLFYFWPVFHKFMLYKPTCTEMGEIRPSTYWWKSWVLFFPNMTLIGNTIDCGLFPILHVCLFSEIMHQLYICNVSLKILIFDRSSSSVLYLNSIIDNIKQSTGIHYKYVSALPYIIKFHFSIEKIICLV